MSKCFLEIPFRVRGRKRITLKVDSADWAELSGYRWYVIAAGYLARRTEIEACCCCRRRRFRIEYLHRVLLDAPGDLQVDHINGDKADNRRENLRLVSASQNMQNRRKWKSKREYRGVHKKGSKFVAEISFQSQKVQLGSFASALEAAKAYDEAARAHYGENAQTNF